MLLWENLGRQASTPEMLQALYVSPFAGYEVEKCWQANAGLFTTYSQLQIYTLHIRVCLSLLFSYTCLHVCPTPRGTFPKLRLALDFSDPLPLVSFKFSPWTSD